MPIHPYIPNSVPEIKKKMLKEIGVDKSDELFSCIPDELKLRRRLSLPYPTPEHEVVRHMTELLSKNVTGNDLLSFLGAGCWPHYIPSVCNEINSRSEFVTAYTGDVYTDLGRYQVLFEFQSMIGELVGLDGVGFPLYDWSTACGDAVRMASIITERKQILVPASMSPDKKEIMQAHCEGIAELESVPYFMEDGQLVIDEIESRINENTAAVYIENPAYLGYLEEQAPRIGELAHDAGSLFIVGVEPLSLGLLEAPGNYGADIVCGEGQPLGMPTAYGGALMGFLAFKDEEEYVAASGNRMITITETAREDEFGFAYIMPERTIFCSRDKAPTSTGTATVLWAITAAVYLSLLGPTGIRELAEVIMKKSQYAIKKLSEISGIRAPAFDAVHFKEFTVDFTDTGKSVEDINKNLLMHGIQGGRNLANEIRELGEAALLCVTEVHSKDDIDRLVRTLEEVV